MNNPNPFEIGYGIGSHVGMTIQVAEGPKFTKGQAPSIYLTDDAFSFVEPALARHATQYGDMSRWGVTEVAVTEWSLIVKDLRGLAERCADGNAPLAVEFNWVHTVDLDNDIETDSEAFGSRFDDPATLKALSRFLVALAEWIEDASRSQQVLTVFGY